MNTISTKTAYRQLKEISTTGRAYPAEGAVFFIQHLKSLFIGHKIDAILNTQIADFHISVEINQILQKDIADYIEWEGPFVFIINNQRLFIDFSAPEHYELGINSQSISDIVDISSKNISELIKRRCNGQFTNISFLYDNNVIGQIIKDIKAIVDDRYKISHLLAIIIELENNVCLTISEEIDNPMLRVYSDINEAMQYITEQKEKTFNFYKNDS